MHQHRQTDGRTDHRQRRARHGDGVMAKVRDMLTDGMSMSGVCVRAGLMLVEMCDAICDPVYLESEPAVTSASSAQRLRRRRRRRRWRRRRRRSQPKAEQSNSRTHAHAHRHRSESQKRRHRNTHSHTHTHAYTNCTHDRPPVDFSQCCVFCLLVPGAATATTGQGAQAHALASAATRSRRPPAPSARAHARARRQSAHTSERTGRWCVCVCAPRRAATMMF